MPKTVQYPVRLARATPESTDQLLQEFAKNPAEEEPDPDTQWGRGGTPQDEDGPSRHQRDDDTCQYGSCSEPATDTVRMVNALRQPTQESMRLCEYHAVKVGTNCPRGDYIEDRPKREMRKYARSTPESLNALLAHVQDNPNDQSAKDALADELDENGRSHEAHFLRNYPEQSMVRNGKVSPFISVFHDISFHQGEDYEEPARILDEEGPDAVMQYLSQWDYGDNRMEGMYQSGSGTDDDAHGPWPVSRTDRNGNVIESGLYHVHHNPRLGYIGMELEEHRPVDLPNPSHTEPVEDFRRGSYQDAKQFADAEVGVPHSIVPWGSDWMVHTAPEHHVEMEDVWSGSGEPKRVPKRKYAAQERRRMTPEQEEAALLEAISKNPEDQTLHHAYADHLADQGRHGEAAFYRLAKEPAGSNEETGKPELFSTYASNSLPEGQAGRYHIFYGNTVHTDDPSVWVAHTARHAPGVNRRASARFSIGDAKHLIKAMESQGIPHEAFGYTPEEGTRYLNLVNNWPDKKEPQQYAAYRAPKGGAVVRGTFYQGGKMIPDMEGDFANPPAPEQSVTPPQYPVKPKRGIKDRLRAGLAKKPLVVSYARATPESLTKLMQAAHHGNQMGTQDPTLHAALAEELTELGRHKEAELARSGRFQIDLNGGGKLKPARPPARIRVDRNTRGLGYRELREQLDHGRSNQIGPNLTIRTGEEGGIRVFYHDNHVVTVHPNGDHTVFTRGWGHAPSTRAVIQRVTGHPMVQRRGNLFYGPQQVPFQEGSRFNNQGEPV